MFSVQLYWTGEVPRRGGRGSRGRGRNWREGRSDFRTDSKAHLVEHRERICFVLGIFVSFFLLLLVDGTGRDVKIQALTHSFLLLLLPPPPLLHCCFPVSRIELSPLKCHPLAFSKPGELFDPH